MKKRPTFTDREATGGEVASRGLEHQKAVMLARLPDWLAIPGFSAVSYEILGDIEVKYFDPREGEVIDFYQVKDKSLTPTELLEIVHDFQCRDTSASFKHFYIVCSSLSQTANPLGEALQRIRQEAPSDARAFYPEGASVKRDTEAEFLERVTAVGGDEVIGDFLLKKVSILHRHGITEENGAALFTEKLGERFPEAQELSRREIGEIFSRVQKLLAGRRGQPITRRQIIGAITNGGILPFPSLKPLGVHTLHDNTPYRGNAIVLPWQSFFGGTDRAYPEAEAWNEQLLGQLTKLKEWLQDTAVSNDLLLTGHRRLSANLALGWTFSAVGGFNLIQEHRGELWRTENHPTNETPGYTFSMSYHEGDSNDLIVSIGIGPVIAGEVETAAEVIGLSRAHRLHLYSADPLTRADQINKAVKDVKIRIAKVLSEASCNTVHLFLAGPGTFALFLGHRLNGLAAVQCYEHKAANVYVPTCLLKAL